LAPGISVVAEPAGGFTALAMASYPDPLGIYLLLRVTNSGSLDTSFRVVGLVSGYDLGHPFDMPTSIARTGDGKMLLLGDSQVDNQNPPIGEVRLWRVTANGFADAAFGAAGRVDVSGSRLQSARLRMTALADGSIALVGSSSDLSTLV
jgi:hypothetical protein